MLWACALALKWALVLSLACVSVLPWAYGLLLPRVYASVLSWPLALPWVLRVCVVVGVRVAVAAVAAGGGVLDSCRSRRRGGVGVAVAAGIGVFVAKPAAGRVTASVPAVFHTYCVDQSGENTPTWIEYVPSPALAGAVQANRCSIVWPAAYA